MTGLQANIVPYSASEISGVSPNIWHFFQFEMNLQAAPTLPTLKFWLFSHNLFLREEKTFQEIAPAFFDSALASSITGNFMKNPPLFNEEISARLGTPSPVDPNTKIMFIGSLYLLTLYKRPIVFDYPTVSITLAQLKQHESWDFVSHHQMIIPEVSTVMTQDQGKIFHWVRRFLTALPQVWDLPFYNGEPDIRGLWRTMKTLNYEIYTNGYQSKTIYIDTTISNSVASSQLTGLKSAYNVGGGAKKTLYLLGWTGQKVSASVMLDIDNLDFGGKIKGTLRVELRLTSAQMVGVTNNCNGVTQNIEFDYQDPVLPNFGTSARVKAWINLDKPFFETSGTITVNVDVTDPSGTAPLSGFQCEVLGIQHTYKSLSNTFGGEPYYSYQVGVPGILKQYINVMGVVHGGGKPYLTSSVPTACQIPGARYQIGPYFNRAYAVDCAPGYYHFKNKCLEKETTNPNCQLKLPDGTCYRCQKSFFLASGSICQPCLPNCDHCLDATTCKRCKENFVIRNEGAGETCEYLLTLPGSSNMIYNAKLQIMMDSLPAGNTLINEPLVERPASSPAIFEKDIQFDISGNGTNFYISFTVYMIPGTPTNEIYSHFDVVVKVKDPHEGSTFSIKQAKSVPFGVTDWTQKKVKFDMQYFLVEPHPDPFVLRIESFHPAVVSTNGIYAKKRDLADDCWIPFTSQKCFFCNHLKNLWNVGGSCQLISDGSKGSRRINYDFQEQKEDCDANQRYCSKREDVNAAKECIPGYLLESGYDSNPYHKRCISLCDPACTTCAIEATNCLTCPVERYLKQTSVGSEPLRHTCVSCSVPNCVKCADHTLECVQCEPSYFLVAGACSLSPYTCPETCTQCEDTSTPVSTKCTACKVHPDSSKRFLLVGELCREASQQIGLDFTYSHRHSNLHLKFWPVVKALPAGLHFELHFDGRKFGVDIRPLDGRDFEEEEYKPDTEVVVNREIKRIEHGEVLLDLFKREKISVDGESAQFEVLEDLFIPKALINPQGSRILQARNNGKFELDLVSGQSSSRGKPKKWLGTLRKLLPNNDLGNYFLKRGNYSLSNTISFYKDTKATEIVKTASAYSSVAVKTVMGMSLVTLSGSFSSLLKLTQHIELIFFLNLFYMPDNLKVFLKYFSENFCELFFDVFKYIETPECSPQWTFEDQGLQCYLIKNIGGIFMLFCITLLTKVVIWLLRIKFLPFAMLNKFFNLSFFFMFFDAVFFDILLYVGIDFSSKRTKSRVGLISTIASVFLTLFSVLVLGWIAVLSFRAAKKVKNFIQEEMENKIESNNTQNNVSVSEAEGDSLSENSCKLSRRNQNRLPKILPQKLRSRLGNSREKLSTDRVSMPNRNRNKRVTFSLPSSSIYKLVRKKTFATILLESAPNYLFEDFKERKLFKFLRLLDQLKLTLCCALLFILFYRPIGQVVLIASIILLFAIWMLRIVPWKTSFDNFVNLTVGLVLSVCLGLSTLFTELKITRPALTSKTNYVMVGYIIIGLLVTIMTLSCIESLKKTSEILKRAYKWLQMTYLQKSKKKNKKICHKKRFRKPSSIIAHKLTKPAIHIDRYRLPSELDRVKRIEESQILEDSHTASLSPINNRLVLDKTNEVSPQRNSIISQRNKFSAQRKSSQVFSDFCGPDSLKRAPFSIRNKSLIRKRVLFNKKALSIKKIRGGSKRKTFKDIEEEPINRLGELKNVASCQEFPKPKSEKAEIKRANTLTFAKSFQLSKESKKAFRNSPNSAQDSE